MIEALLEAGANPNTRDWVGESPLHAAVTSYPVYIVSSTSERFVDKLERQKVADNPEIVEVLLAAGADPSARDVKGRTALHLAAEHTIDPTAVLLLLEAGSNIEARDYKDLTPLHMATMSNASSAITDALIDAGADVDARGAKELTALHWAASENVNPAIIDVLIDAGADIDARAAQEWIALHVAAEQTEAPAVVEALVDAGADPTALNDKGENAWDLAQGNDALSGTAIYERLRMLVGE